jgi:transitional endoplasmic reticulum ATPase
VHVEISVLPRVVVHKKSVRPLCEALVTAAEAAHFEGFDAVKLYKSVGGMNPVRLRDAIAYAVNEAGEGRVPVQQLNRSIRVFKTKTSANFEAPDVSFDEIGGYDDVKAEMIRALSLMTGSYDKLPEKLQHELIPRGFIFYGEPGTGKTLFAKAIANYIDATLQVVSGPEITDKYVGESERKLRELFAEARRNAPSVLVFDEFDSIAGRRTRRDDGGSRAGNAIVAQILTEMDGFRPDAPVLVIGTTNRLDMIDPALLRPSRFQAIAIGLPNEKARLEIARVHAEHFGIKVSPTLLQLVRDKSEGFNGDEIRSLFRDACVGMNCEDPPKPVDAHRLGYLIGLIQAGKQRFAAEAGREPVQPGERPRPSAGRFIQHRPRGTRATGTGAAGRTNDAVPGTPTPTPADRPEGAGA